MTEPGDQKSGMWKEGEKVTIRFVSHVLTIDKHDTTRAVEYFSSISTIAHFGPLLYFFPTSHRHAAPLESDVECLSGKASKKCIERERVFRLRVLEAGPIVFL